MEYIHGLSTQGKMFLFSLGFGFLLGFLYDLFRLLRLASGNSKGVTLFADLTYSLVCAFLSFLFLLVLDGGRVRLYSVGGEITGFLIYYFSLGIIVSRFLAEVCDGIKRFFALILTPVRLLFTKIFSRFALLLNFMKKTLKKFKKKQNTSCKNNT